MSALNRNPETQDFLSPLGFEFSLTRAPAVNFFVQKAEVPGITIGSVSVPTPFIAIPFAGTSLTYGDFPVTFKVDERLQSYFEMYNWMKAMGFPDNFDQYKVIADDLTRYQGVMSDASLIILSNQKRPIYTVTFKDIFPISLGPLRFDTTQQQLDYLTVDVMFKYRTFDISSA